MTAPPRTRWIPWPAPGPRPSRYLYRGRHRRRRPPSARRALVLAGLVVVAVLLAAGVGDAAFAAAAPAIAAEPNSLPQVITNLRNWLMGILAAIATLFAVLAGVYWATAGGDPAQVDKAKGALRNALVGYGAAVLAPVFLQVVRGIVGG